MVRIFGSLADRNIRSSHPVSLSVIGNIQSEIFPIIFQINLFSLVTEWSHFFLLLFTIEFIETATRCFSVSPLYARMHDAMCEHSRNQKDQQSASFFTFCAHVFARINDYRSGVLTVDQSAIRLCMKIIINISALISYMFFSIVLRCGYNKHFYNVQSSSSANFERLLAFVCVYLGVEILLIAPTDVYVKKSSNYSLFNRWVSFFDINDGQEYYVFLVWALTHVTTDVFIAKIDYLRSSDRF